MSKQKSPLTPMRAHHRILKSIVSSSFGKDLEPRPEEYDLIARIFKRAGGSWEGVFKGSIDEIELLKKAVKVAVKKGAITKKPNWSA
ncbi:hypothetical protein N9917_01040 [Deltaproteobacteria bacterium]|nr:hypothetical protein [Deltaproteobacteria bacterium]